MSPPRSSRIAALLERLRAENIETWFDLGLMLDRLRDERAGPSAPAGFADFRRKLARGVAFVTYRYAIDGVTMEIAKYADAMRSRLPNVRIHMLGGHFGTGAFVRPREPLATQSEPSRLSSSRRIRIEAIRPSGPAAL